MSGKISVDEKRNFTLIRSEKGSEEDWTILTKEYRKSIVPYFENYIKEAWKCTSSMDYGGYYFIKMLEFWGLQMEVNYKHNASNIKINNNILRDSITVIFYWYIIPGK